MLTKKDGQITEAEKRKKHGFQDKFKIIFMPTKKKTQIKSSLPIPTADRILVTKKKPESVTPSGIIIPEIVLNPEKEGIIVAMGPLVNVKGLQAAKDAGMDPKYEALFEIGSHVLYGEYAGNPVSYNGEEYLLMREADVLCIIP